MKYLYDKSITDIFLENNKIGLVYGQLNIPMDQGYDPLHSNDIQPVLEDGEFWEKGDIWVSLRNRSMIFLYRPSSNELVRIVQGPMIAQHDVDIISDHEISVFNNNKVYIPSERKSDPSENGEEKAFKIIHADTLSSSNMLVYNLQTDSFSYPFQGLFEKEGISSLTQGLTHSLSDGSLFVESQNQRKLFIFKDSQVVYKKAFLDFEEKRFAPTHWYRIYEDITPYL